MRNSPSVVDDEVVEKLRSQVRYAPRPGNLIDDELIKKLRSRLRYAPRGAQGTSSTPSVAFALRARTKSRSLRRFR